MNGWFWSLGLLLGGSLLSLLLSRRPAWAAAAAATTTLLAAVPGLGFAFGVLAGAPATLSFTAPWHVPFGRLALGADPLSAFFMIPLFLLAAAASLFGVEYVLRSEERDRAGLAGCLLNLLTASMAVVLTARNVVLFLGAWELMALSSFGLVIFQRREPGLWRAGWSYLVASQAGTMFLFFLFGILGRGRMDFADFATGTPTRAGLCFMLALVGFGTKAGLVPLHVWLPEAHPAAPSHVSALMSGVMIKMGIYGLLRVVFLLHPLPAWCAWLMLGVGLSSGLLGVLFALAQHDIKRLLAYHSVENIGIITLGIGLGMLGLVYHMGALAVLGFAGGLLHVLNHALFKGLLFLAAGVVTHAAHTRDLDRLGGWLRRLPLTATLFLVGAAAIAGLPPFNGFVSEFLIFFASLGALAGAPAGAAWGALAGLVGLALIGGLALACFAKAFGAIFLGTPRGPADGRAHEPGWCMLAPMLALAAACLGIGLYAAPAVGRAALALVGPLRADLVAREMTLPLQLASRVSRVFFFFLLGAGALALVRRWLLRSREVRAAVTWDCGYAAPTARMQYTASSFAAPLVTFFRPVLGTATEPPRLSEPFPAASRLATHTPDLFAEWCFRRPAEWVLNRLRFVRNIQHGQMSVYILYLALTLLALLLWGLP